MCTFMKTTPMDFIIVGKIGAPYGVKGWIKVQSFTDPEENILHYEPWFLSDKNNQWKEALTEGRQTHGQSFLVKLEGINNPEEARLYTGKLIAIARTQLPKLEKNEYYWSDLQGLTVINKDGVNVGTVTGLLETGSNDVLIVKGEKEFAVPYLVGKTILSINLEKREIHIDWEPI